MLCINWLSKLKLHWYSVAIVLIFIGSISREVCCSRPQGVPIVKSIIVTKML